MVIKGHGGALWSLFLPGRAQRPVPSAAFGAGHFSKCAKGRLKQMAPLGATLPVSLTSPSPLLGASRARLGQTGAPGPLTPVMTAASPAGGVSSSSGSRSRSSSGALRGLLMAPSGLAAVGGRWGRGAGALAGAPSSGLAGGYREPPGGYKGEHGRDSCPRLPVSPRGGHCAGTPPLPTPHSHARAHRGPPASETTRAAALRPAPPPRAPRRQRPPRGSPLPAILWARLAAAAFRTRRNRLCRLRHNRLVSWFPKLHVFSANKTCSSFVPQMFRERLLRARLWTHRGEGDTGASEFVGLFRRSLQSSRCTPGTPAGSVLMVQ